MREAPLSIAFFASGNGSAVRFVQSQVEAGILAVQIDMLITNKADCGAANWARAQALPVHILDRDVEKPANDASCLAKVQAAKVDLIVLGGFLRKIGPKVLRAYEGRIINLHPALLPKYGGKGMYGRHVHRAVLAAGEKFTGATIHLVNEAYDEGAIFLQRKVPIIDGEDEDSLAAKVIEAEGELLSYCFRHGLGNMLMPRVQ